jgi:hypothetical protein
LARVQREIRIGAAECAQPTGALDELHRRNASRGAHALRGKAHDAQLVAVERDRGVGHGGVVAPQFGAF